MASHAPSSNDGVHVGTKYQTYKAATASVAGWLSRQAHKLGLTSGSTSDSKERKGCSKYALSVDDYYAFTQAIVDADPRIGIPLEIVNLAGKAYSLRKEWAKILRGQDEDSDKRHAHFISVIGQVFEQLKAHCDAESSSSSHQAEEASNGKISSSSTKIHEKTNSSKKGHAANHFDPLRAEAGAEDDWSDQEDGIESTQVEVGAESEAKREDGTINREARRKAKKLMRKKKSKANRKAQEKATKEYEELLSNSDGATYLDEGEEDPYFVIMCLLSDLSLMRDFVKEMWADYSCNKIDLVTVSLTTNATFDIIRTYELDCPAIAPLLKDYSKTLQLILGEHFGDEKDEGLKCLFHRRNTPEQFDTMCSSLCWIEDLVELTCANAFYFLNGPRHDLVWRKPDGQGGMGINLTRDPFGPLVQDLDLRELIYDDRLMHDIRLLASYAQDVYATNNHDTCMLDHFTMQWKEFARTGNKTVSLSEAFGAQMYLDMHHLSHADLSSAFLDLKGKAWQLHQALTAWEDKERVKRKAMWEGDLSACMTMSFISNCAYTLTQQTGQMVIDKRLFIEQKNALYRAAGLSDRFDEAKDKSFLEKNPLLCGISQFILLSGVRECGQTIAVHPRSILSAGQLYFACRMHRQASGRKGTTYEPGVSSSWADYVSNGSWPDMEYVFEMSGEKAFFEGHVPTSNHEIVQHNGTVKYLDEASGKKTKTQVNTEQEDFSFPSMAPPKAGDRPYKRLDSKYDLMHYDALDVTRQLYHKKYAIYHPSAEHFALTSSWTEGSLLALLGSKYSASCQDEGNGEEGGGENLWEKVVDMSHLSPLKSLKRCLRNEAKALHFDMLSFHMRCIDLLTAMRDKLFKTIHRFAPVDAALFRDDNDAKIMWLACKLYFAASAREIQGGLWQVGTTPTQPVPLFTSMLHVAIDKTLQDFLTSHGCRSTEVDKVNDWHGFCQLDAKEAEYYRLKQMLMDLRTC